MLLSAVEPIRVNGDLEGTCLEHRAELLVARRMPSSDLVSVAVPIDFEPEKIRGVVAAVAGGPHSALAAWTAHSLAGSLGVAGLMVCAYRRDDERERAVATVERLFPVAPGLEYRTLGVESVGGLIAQLPEGSLLVLGAPGGNWFQRMLFSAGARLRQRAPNGAVLVRHAVPRAYQAMGAPVFVGPLHEAGDILRLHRERVLAVVEEGRLFGLVRRADLELADPRAAAESLMGPPHSLDLRQPLEEAGALRDVFGEDPIPVVDDELRLVGSLTLTG